MKQKADGLGLGRNYRIVRRLGSGGMGDVYLVEHTRIQRQFAAKVLHRLRSDDPSSRQRLRREAESLAVLRHPHIVSIVDFDFDDDVPFLVMDYLEGQSLAERMGDEPLPWPDLARIGDQVLSALAAAHGKGIVHRDLKPENIVLARDDSGDERAMLVDFGIARAETSSGSLTGDDVVGTPSYMAPEQVQGIPAGPEADLWAFGVLLFEMATGTVPFARDTLQATIYAILESPVPDVRQQRPDATPAFSQLVSELLEKSPERRTNRAAVARSRLSESLAELPGPDNGNHLHSPSTVREAPSRVTQAGAGVPGNRYRGVRWGIALAALLVVAAVALPYLSSQSEEQKLSSEPEGQNRSPAAVGSQSAAVESGAATATTDVPQAPASDPPPAGNPADESPKEVESPDTESPDTEVDTLQPESTSSRSTKSRKRNRGASRTASDESADEPEAEDGETSAERRRLRKHRFAPIDDVF